MPIIEASADRCLLSEQPHELIFQKKIIPKIFSGAKAQANPRAIIFGGQPGSGKSAAISSAEEELALLGGAVLIAGDDLRDFHPQYATLLIENDKLAAYYTDKDTGRWVEKSIAYAKTLRCNMIIEGTMRLPEKVAATMQLLREAGYTIEARVLAVNQRWSWQGILQRYESQYAALGHGRMTTSETHQAGYNGVIKTIEYIEREKLADHVRVYKRGHVILYENELQNKQWKHNPIACLVVQEERQRPLTPIEYQEYVKNFDDLLKLINRPERNAAKEEIAAIEELMNKAYQ